MNRTIVAILMIGAGVAWAADTPSETMQEATQNEATPAPESDPNGVTVKRGIGGEVQEYRVGGRLESMTINRDRGTTDYWYDRRGDTTWEASQGEVGEKENLRQWKIGNW